MGSLAPINPRPFLQELVEKEVLVRLKWNGAEYRGTLVSIDSYMNVQLSSAEEFLEGKSQGKLGDVFIRCNNVLWIGQAGEVGEAEYTASGAAKKENGDSTMS